MDHHEHADMLEVLAEHFEEEIEDACEYAKLAEEYHDEHIALWELGREEATHANYLHSLAPVRNTPSAINHSLLVLSAKYPNNG